MSETGRTYRRTFKCHPSEAAGVRTWTASRSPHADAPAVANELFVAVLGAGADTIDVTLSTADTRPRITATGHDPDRKSVVWVKRVSVLVDLGGRRIIKKKKPKQHP